MCNAGRGKKQKSAALIDTLYGVRKLKQVRGPCGACLDCHGCGFCLGQRINMASP
jgi:hypothetical protein